MTSITAYAPAEHAASEAFTRQSALFDDLYAGNTIVAYKRERVRGHITALLKPQSHILELNSGTGQDALFFANAGHYIHATDISVGMQTVLKNKVQAAGMANQVTTEICSFTQLSSLQNRGPFDAIFSNFAGLNCTGELDQVLANLSPLLKPGATVTLVLLPQFCLWETLLIFKGKVKTATRRWFAAKGVKAHIEGTYFKCWYYNPSYVISRLKTDFQHLSTEGLCSIVPPSYIEGFAEKYPMVYALLTAAEHRCKSKWPFKFIGDYYIISFRKK